jgi:hypothetical protein
MTLLEFTNKLFAVGDNTTVYVCDCEPDGYGEEVLRNHIDKESALIMTHLSCFVLDHYCKPEICNAKVDQIYALGKDEYLVVVDMEDD